MNEHELDHASTGDDADLASLLRAVGPRLQPPEDAMAEVRAAVAAEWRTTVAARQQVRMPARRRVMQPWMAMAASVAAIAIAVGIALPRWNGAGDPVATVARVSG
ncbi:MAG: hypothetical protein RL261_386, partial [Pseudomonadota bacterium]